MAAPTLPPPNGNPSSPITTSATEQEKLGGFMIATQSGQVGIGTSNPGYKLDIQGGQINSSGGLCIAADCKTAWSQVGGGSSQWTTSGSDIYYTTGNVGIGTTSPESKLHVFVGSAGTLTEATENDDFIIESSSNAGMSISAPDGGQTTLGFASPSDVRLAQIYANYNSGNRFLRFAISDDVKMTILGTGNVGIGTTSPTKKLHVYGQPSEIRVTGSSGTTEDFDVGTSNLVGHYLWGYGLYDLVFATNNAERMRITSSGNAGVVAIGTTNTTGANAGDIVLNNTSIRGLSAGSTFPALYPYANEQCGNWNVKQLGIGPTTSSYPPAGLSSYRVTGISTTPTPLFYTATPGGNNTKQGYFFIVNGTRGNASNSHFMDVMLWSQGTFVKVSSLDQNTFGETRTYDYASGYPQCDATHPPNYITLQMSGGTYDVSVFTIAMFSEPS